MSKEQPVYLTEEGLQKVREELDYLKNTRRKEVAQQIAEAKAEGDLRENAGYDEAKTQQGFLEGKIRELENVVKNVQIIQEGAKASDTVAIGLTVYIVEEGTDFEEKYEIVGKLEADPTNGRISNESPMGKALLGKKRGNKVPVETPGGEITFEIIRIE